MKKSLLGLGLLAALGSLPITRYRNDLPDAWVPRSRGKGGAQPHCINSGVRAAKRAAIKRRNRARNKAHH